MAGPQDPVEATLKPVRGSGEIDGSTTAAVRAAVDEPLRAMNGDGGDVICLLTLPRGPAREPDDDGAIEDDDPAPLREEDGDAGEAAGCNLSPVTCNLPC